jgi:2-polyprenyl-3-methyl-5-hydroxy-6-metoxy-1,4-benzoquinol methylase
MQAHEHAWYLWAVISCALLSQCGACELSLALEDDVTRGQVERPLLRSVMALLGLLPCPVAWRVKTATRIHRALAPDATVANSRYQSRSVAYSHDDGAVDSVSVEKAGLIRVEGWLSSDTINDSMLPRCFANCAEVSPFEVFRTYRPDVAAAIKVGNPFLGLVVLYRVPDHARGALTQLKLTYREESIFESSDLFQIQTPAYSNLLDATDVLHRADIYGYGPPATTVIEEVKSLGRMLPAPILDFGCGSGALIKALRAENIGAYGIELDRPAVVQGLLTQAKNYIRLYDGSFPMPFADGEFESVIAVEVIEHIPEFEQALAEVARVARNSFVMTVPDMSSIPICHHNNVVPWHLLESTHVNFFTQTSLRKSLSAHFKEVQLARMCPTVINGSKWFGSLIAVCHK